MTVIWVGGLERGRDSSKLEERARRVDVLRAIPADEPEANLVTRARTCPIGDSEHGAEAGGLHRARTS